MSKNKKKDLKEQIRKNKNKSNLKRKLKRNSYNIIFALVIIVILIIVAVTLFSCGSDDNNNQIEVGNVEDNNNDDNLNIDDEILNDDEYEINGEIAPSEEEPFVFNLTLIDRNNDEITIYGDDIDISYHNGSIEFNEQLLNQQISNIQSRLSGETESRNARIISDGTNFIIENEVLGDSIDEERLHNLIIYSIENQTNRINLVEENVYIRPAITSDSYELTTALNQANRMLNSVITYSVGNNVVNRTQIKDWIFIDGLNIGIHEYRVRNWVNNLANRIDSVQDLREITTPAGRTAILESRNYGWRVNRYSETTTLINNIRNGDIITREPVFSQRAVSHTGNDFGNTYIHIDIATQQLWLIQNGNVTLSTSITTGINGFDLVPVGILSITEISRNVPFPGEYPAMWDSDQPLILDYWMRISGNIGIHDARWQEDFGGAGNINFGSNGSINMSTETARQLFNAIYVGIPVIIHH